MKTVSTGLAPIWISRVAFGAGALVGVAWLLGPVIDDFLRASFIAGADRQAAEWLHASTSPSLAEFMRWISVFHGTAGILAMAAIAATALWLNGERVALLILAASVPGGMLLNVAVKHAVQRARPDWGYAQQALETFSFPSGHTAGAALLYGVIVAWLWPRLRSAWTRVALLSTATSLVLLVAASRIALGVHFLSDCIAAVFEAMLWLAICLVGARPVRWATSAARGEP